MVIRGIHFGYLTVISIAATAALLPVPENERSSSLIKIAVYFVILIAIIQPTRLIFKKHPHPINQLKNDIKNNRHRIASCIALYFSLAVTLQTFTGIKKLIPSVMPFYADPMLIELDRTLFFGSDPWQITHSLFGWATPSIVVLYSLWHTMHILIPMWIALSKNEERKI